MKNDIEQATAATERLHQRASKSALFGLAETIARSQSLACPEGAFVLTIGDLITHL